MGSIFRNANSSGPVHLPREQASINQSPIPFGPNLNLNPDPDWHPDPDPKMNPFPGNFTVISCIQIPESS
ncbi:hypothetical protein JCGZ_11692 [Jatropha curcas]|uniref:Uncharacterized protein n=1 Tax=Jatropha curcas TaxID=180498 RepID=A0A067K521_JATCU|nr:hypothetical protein JCGZ_11692 [Jatropha curcas]